MVVVAVVEEPLLTAIGMTSMTNISFEFRKHLKTFTFYETGYHCHCHPWSYRNGTLKTKLNQLKQPIKCKNSQIMFIRGSGGQLTNSQRRPAPQIYETTVLFFGHKGNSFSRLSFLLAVALKWVLCTRLHYEGFNKEKVQNLQFFETAM